MTPIVPGNFQGMRDTLVRFPMRFMGKRPSFLNSPNKTRMGKKTQEANQPPNNVLDPLKIGNERQDESNG
jgi:spore germination protein KA